VKSCPCRLGLACGANPKEKRGGGSVGGLKKFGGVAGHGTLLFLCWVKNYVWLSKITGFQDLEPFRYLFFPPLPPFL